MKIEITKRKELFMNKVYLDQEAMVFVEREREREREGEGEGGRERERVLISRIAKRW